MSRARRFLLLPLLIFCLAFSGCVHVDWRRSVMPIISSGFSNISARQQRRAVFSWHEEAMEKSARDTLLLVLEEAGADTLYQNLYNVAAEQTDPFLADMAVNGITVYALLGDPSWALPHGQDAMLKEVAETIEIAERTGCLSGLVLDVEPRQLEKWGDDPERVMKAYVQNMCAAYDKAAEAGIKLVLCIPASYDSFPHLLETLIADGCDDVAVMNYQRGAEYGRIALEAKLAKQYGKTLIQISELQAPGQHGLTEEHTYYGLGSEDLLDTWATLDLQFNNQEIMFAYHDYETLRTLLANETAQEKGSEAFASGQ